MKILLALLALAAVQIVSADTAKSIQEIPLKDINGKPTSLAAYKGKVVLLVNVASKCGYTAQYKGLEATYKKFKDQGLVIVGIPSNDFGGQEPGTAEEIKSFCEKNFGVTFPLMEKVSVKGPEQHPLYSALTGKGATYPGDVKWNFGKFLIGRDGKVLSRYDSKVAPESDELTKAIEGAIATR
ncbi:MAG: glutathione peroxidase [Opitutaceae bacterium]|nr:glutathione peroxidase [Verrucomicrobiales bacterium]